MHEMAKLLGIMKPFICSVGDWIFEAGEHGKDMYILVHGVVEFCRKDSMNPYTATEAPNCFAQKMAFGLVRVSGNSILDVVGTHDLRLLICVTNGFF